MQRAGGFAEVTTLRYTPPHAMPPSTLGSEMNVRRRLLPAAVLALAVLPPVLLARAIARIAVDAPYWDAWVLGGDLAAWLDGTFDWQLLWRQHNDHRVPVPRLALLGLARLSGWDTRWELWLNLAIVIAALVCLAAALRRILATQPLLAALSVLVASLLLFSPAASENWSWGWQATVFLALLAVAALALLFATWRGRWWQVALAAVLTAMAVGSFASGLVLVGVVPAVIVLHPDGGAPRRRMLQAGAALTAGALLVLLYFWDFQHPAHHPAAQSDAFLLTYYTLAYLGAPWTTALVADAVRWGAAGVAALVLLLGILARSGHGARRILAPLLFLCAFSLLNGAITGVGRVGFGVGQALAPRYITFASLFWIGLFPMIGLVVGRVVADGGAVRSLVVGIVLGAALATAARDYDRSWSEGLERMTTHSVELRYDVGCLRWLDPAPDACVRRLFADGAGVRDTTARLAAHGYGPRRHPPPRPPLARLGRPLPDGARGAVESITVTTGPRPVVQLRGAAVDAQRALRAASVVAVADGVIVGRSGTWNRPPNASRSGSDVGRWQMTIPTYRLGNGGGRLEIWAVLRDGRGVAPLPGGPWTVDLPK